MRSEHDWVYESIRLYHLMKEHPDWGYRRLARTLGHDLKWVAKWKSRILSHEQITLEVFRSVSRAPNISLIARLPKRKSFLLNYVQNYRNGIIPHISLDSHIATDGK